MFEALKKVAGNFRIMSEAERAEAYLADAESICDLEYRMAQLDRGNVRFF